MSTEIADFDSAKADGRQDVYDAEACPASAELAPRMTVTATRWLDVSCQQAIDPAEGRAVLHNPAERERDGKAGRCGIQMECLDQRRNRQAKE